MFDSHKCQAQDSPTHLLMNGGKLKVSDIRAFHDEYFQCIKMNKSVSVVEKVQKNRPFKMFFDFDFKEPLEDKEQFIIHFLHSCEEYLCKTIKAVVCLGIGGTNGIHIVLTDVVVEQEVGIRMCNALKTKKNNLDVSVYKTGLRMIWSHKKNIRQYYTPRYIWVNSTLTDLTTEESMDIRFLDSCSIHTTQEANCAVNNVDDVSVPLCQEVADTGIIQENLAQLHPIYGKAKVTRIVRVKNDYIIQTYSRFCLNLNASHRSNHVYFVMRKRKLFQKCYCSCDTTKARVSGKCKNFSSKSVPIGWRCENLIKKSVDGICLFN